MARVYIRFDNQYLEDAEPCDSIAEAKRYFETTARDLARYGQEVTASLHVYDRRITEGNHCQEYPDYLLSIGPRGGVRVERT